LRLPRKLAAPLRFSSLKTHEPIFDYHLPLNFLILGPYPKSTFSSLSSVAIMAEVANPATTPSLQLDGNQSNEAVNDENAAPTSSAPAVTNGKNVTVFHDRENFNVKHPLQHQWTLWFTKPPSGKGDNWNDLLKEVVTFDSVEEFWGVYV
jgi:Eukaryotic initiation factor 4E